MTREEKQQIKAKKKEYEELLKRVAKKHDVKHKSFMLFFTHKNYFVSVYHRFSIPRNTISYSIGLKYMDYDDIQWDILDMSENKNQPLSLRATGAFSAFEYGLGDEKIISLGENPEAVLNNILSEIKQMVENFNEDLDKTIVADLEKKPCSTLEFIVYIHQKQYAKARKLAEDCIANGDTGQFGNNGKDFFELALEYLDKNNL
ncbi:MAG: hypothetical protein IJ530_04425 [Treponema sp.]|uniref:hypothetical protein n=1 Tax=Treponema sp. TaxID=166 RepID=UPI0025CD7D70|nr:hypothetical protein [Treponema sp.]MBQ8678991.1 hypothetical protein [Treponema sp.]